MEKVFDEKLAAELFPPKQKDGHKGTYGTLAIIGGCERYVGAPYLAALGGAALRIGTGIVKIAAPRSVLPALQSRITHCTLFPLDEKDGYIDMAEEHFAELVSNASAVICGMGIGNTPQTAKSVRLVIQKAKCPLLLDADALNILSEDTGILAEREYPTVLTPHIGEMSRLAKLDAACIKADKIQIATGFAAKHGVIVLLKDAESVITDGDTVYLNRAGTPAMAKGGSGDLLSGVIGGLLARKTPPLKAAAAGAFIAGKAAEKAVLQSNEYSLFPSETAEYIKSVITDITKKRG